MKNIFPALIAVILMTASCKKVPSPPVPVVDSCIDSSKILHGVCTKEYAPVCGCNGVTYRNESSARINGLKSWTKGPCPDGKQ